MTDEEELQLAATGDQSAFLRLYQRHRDGIYRFAYRMVGDASAEDVTHECFVSLIEHPHRFAPGRASLRTYLFAAARNLALKRLRDAPNVGESNNIDEQPALNGTGPLGLLLDEEIAGHVRKAIAVLTPLEREALILFEYEELSLAEIAAVVDADVGTVKARLHRARERLRSLLARLVGRENCVR